MSEPRDRISSKSNRPGYAQVIDGASTFCRLFPGWGSLDFDAEPSSRPLLWSSLTPWMRIFCGSPRISCCTWVPCRLPDLTFFTLHSTKLLGKQKKAYLSMLNVLKDSNCDGKKWSESWSCNGQLVCSSVDAKRCWADYRAAATNATSTNVSFWLMVRLIDSHAVCEGIEAYRQFCCRFLF